MFAPVARLTDMHVCPMQTPAVVPIPHVGGPVVGPGAPTVLAGGMPVSVVGDMSVCVGPPDVHVVGSFTVLAEGKPIVRIADPTAHGGVVLVGLPTVMIGDSGGAGGGAGQAMSAAKAGGSAFARTDCSAKTVAAAAAVAPKPPADAGPAWVELEVVDQGGKPIPYQRVRVVDADGTERFAYSDVHGVARVNGMKAGTCHITLADLDESSWTPG